MQKLKLLIAGLLFSLAVNAQKVAISPTLPLDPAVKIGKLPNGITYYIRKNAEPKKRAELRLIVRAGSTLETDEQQGLAHFMEHMSFNGTKNFPKNDLVNFLQKSGVKFGADLNAFTSFDETVYELPVPTDSSKLYERSLQILEDWAHNATLDSTEIEKERGVVLEESRLRGKNAQQRMRDKYFPIILNNSRYATRLPIGLDNILKTFKKSALSKFYKDWYRPDLQAVIVVGDVDIDQTEAMIKEKFGKIPPAAKTAPKHIKYDILPHKETRVAVVTDKENPQTVVQIIHKMPEASYKTEADKRQSLVREMYNTLFGNRVNELTQKADPPFLFGFGNYGSFLGNLDAYVSVALAKDAAGSEKAIKALTTENLRVKKFGFTAPEFDRAKTQYMTELERRLKEKDKTRSAVFVQPLIGNFLRKTPFTSIEYDVDFAKKYLGSLKLEEINALVNQFTSNENSAILVLGPEKDKDKLPSEKQILEWINDKGTDITPYQDNFVNKPLLPTLPKGSKVVSETKTPELGITELKFANGVRVILKPTDYKNDQIAIVASSKGGASLIPDADFESSEFSSYLVNSGGIGEFSSVQLQKLLTGKTVEVSPYINDQAEGFNGSCSPKDFETALQLIYGYFTAPRKDADVAKGILTNQKAYLQNKIKTPTPEGIFSDSSRAVLSNYAFRRLAFTPEQVDKVSLDKAMEIYKDRFADASDFTFVLVGNFDNEKIKPLLEQYLGGLPSTNRKESWKDLGIKIPKGKIERTFYKGLEPKSRVSLVFSGDYDFSEANNVQLDGLEEALTIKLTEKLREEESGVYGVGCSASYEKLPTGRYNFKIGFGCAPENVEKLIAKTLEEINKIRQNGADIKDIEKFVAETTRKTEVDIKTNEFWLSYLDQKLFTDEDPKEILRLKDDLKTVTTESTKAAANKYLSGENYIRLVLMPEKK